MSRSTWSVVVLTGRSSRCTTGRRSSRELTTRSPTARMKPCWWQVSRRLSIRGSRRRLTSFSSTWGACVPSASKAGRSPIPKPSRGRRAGTRRARRRKATPRRIHPCRSRRVKRSFPRKRCRLRTRNRTRAPSSRNEASRLQLPRKHQRPAPGQHRRALLKQQGGRRLQKVNLKLRPSRPKQQCMNSGTQHLVQLTKASFQATGRTGKTGNSLLPTHGQANVCLQAMPGRCPGRRSIHSSQSLSGQRRLTSLRPFTLRTRRCRTRTCTSWRWMASAWMPWLAMVRCCPRTAACSRRMGWPLPTMAWPCITGR
mmetsp:Transcript_18272/g.43301  ORF Transcript_18272/g.43301 Transcript_18272/m.43301 type:complete len:312 (+) Transcript_18272:93-1028(+)